jgi:hypothetical protein
MFRASAGGVATTSISPFRSVTSTRTVSFRPEMHASRTNAATTRHACTRGQQTSRGAGDERCGSRDITAHRFSTGLIARKSTLFRSRGIPFEVRNTAGLQEQGGNIQSPGSWVLVTVVGEMSELLLSHADVFPIRMPQGAAPGSLSRRYFPSQFNLGEWLQIRSQSVS